MLLEIILQTFLAQKNSKICECEERLSLALPSEEGSAQFLCSFLPTPSYITPQVPAAATIIKPSAGYKVQTKKPAHLLDIYTCGSPEGSAGGEAWPITTIPTPAICLPRYFLLTQHVMHQVGKESLENALGKIEEGNHCLKLSKGKGHLGGAYETNFGVDGWRAP